MSVVEAWLPVSISNAARDGTVQLRSLAHSSWSRLGPSASNGRPTSCSPACRVHAGGRLTTGDVGLRGGLHDAGGGADNPPPSAGAFAPVAPTGKRSSCEPASTNGRATWWKNNGMDLVDWSGQVPSSGEKPPSGERFPRSLPVRSIKVSTQKPAEPAPQRGRCPSREWLEEVRLEQRWEPGSNVLCAPGDRWMEANARVARRRGSRPRRPRVMRRHP
jgi:hypothetical protein